MLKLSRLPFNWKESPKLFERYWDNTMTQLEDILNQLLALPVIQDAIDNLDTAVADAQSAADAANTAAAAANSAAGTAQATTDAQKAETSLVNSFVQNFTAPLISADSAGTVTVANHDRVYGDVILNPAVSVTGGSFATTASIGDVVRVYYDDPGRAGGSVTYQYTIDPTASPVQSGNRHSVGAVTIPAVGTQDGNYVRPPGYVNP